jgi:capsid protein
MRSGASTLADVVTRRGKDWQEVVTEHGQVMEALDDLGLIFDADPRRTSKAGTAQDHLRERGDTSVITEEEATEEEFDEQPTEQAPEEDEETAAA